MTFSTLQLKACLGHHVHPPRAGQLPSSPPPQRQHRAAPPHAGHTSLPLPSGVTQIDRIVEVVEEALKGNTMQLLAKKALPRLDLPKVQGGEWEGGKGRGRHKLSMVWIPDGGGEGDGWPNLSGT